MSWEDDLKTVVERTGVKRYEYLCSEAYYDHKRMREDIRRMAAQSDFPPLAQQAYHVVGAIGRVAVAAATGQKVRVNEETLAARRATCQGCEHLVNSRCALCGCFYQAKIVLTTEKCPIGLWPAVTEPEQ